MMKRNKAILCAVASFGLITAANTINVNAMTMKTTTSSVQTKLTVSQVEDLIDALPYTITFKNIDKVKEAREAYNSLTQSEQSKIPYYTLDTLTSAEKRVERFEAEEAKAKELVNRIEELKATVNYNGDTDKIDRDNLKASKDNIIDIRNNYEGLNYYVKAKVSNYEDFFKIECKLTEVAYN